MPFGLRCVSDWYPILYRLRPQYMRRKINILLRDLSVLFSCDFIFTVGSSSHYLVVEVALNIWGYLLLTHHATQPSSRIHSVWFFNRNKLNLDCTKVHINIETKMQKKFLHAVDKKNNLSFDVIRSLSMTFKPRMLSWFYWLIEEMELLYLPVWKIYWALKESSRHKCNDTRPDHHNLRRSVVLICVLYSYHCKMCVNGRPQQWTGQAKSSH